MRHRFVGVSVRFDGVQATLHDLSNDGLAFDVADARHRDASCPGARSTISTLVRAAASVCLRGVRALVRHVGRSAPGRYRVGCALKPRRRAAMPAVDADRATRRSAPR